MQETGENAKTKYAQQCMENSAFEITTSLQSDKIPFHSQGLLHSIRHKVIGYDGNLHQQWKLKQKLPQCTSHTEKDEFNFKNEF
jgi:hypothetical protein